MDQYPENMKSIKILFGTLNPYPRHEWDRRLCGPQNRSGRYEVEKNVLPVPGIEPRSSSPSLGRMSYPSSLGYNSIYISLKVNRCFGGKYCLHLQSQRVSYMKDQDGTGRHQSKQCAKKKNTRFLQIRPGVHNPVIFHALLALLSASFMLASCLTLKFWKWRRNISPKLRLTFADYTALCYRRQNPFVATAATIPNALWLCQEVLVL
jgi:hypothetical protein